MNSPRTPGYPSTPAAMPPAANRPTDGTDGAWWIVPAVVGTCAAAAALPMNFALALWSMLPLDSCDSDGCGGGPTGWTALFALGTIISLVCVTLCWVLRRPTRRMARIALAVVAVLAAVLPLIAFRLVIFSG